MPASDTTSSDTTVPAGAPLLAVVPVRDGEVPAGAGEAVAECAGRALLVGSGLDAAAVDAVVGQLSGEGGGVDVGVLPLGEFEPGRWSAALAGEPLVAGARVVVLPASPDGRDLAPRLAHAMRRPLHAGAVRVTADRATVPRRGGAELHTFRLDQPAVATLQPGVRGIDAVPEEARHVTVLDAAASTTAAPADVRVLAVHPPDLATMDLAESPRILGGGAGLDDAARFGQLGRVAAALGAVTGATRVVTDRGWVDHDRQIGTTGVVVDPDLYVAFGVSGAVQHTSGLGAPDHVISVNTDPHCPMMQLADLAVVADANAVLDELERLLAPGHAEGAA